MTRTRLKRIQATGLALLLVGVVLLGTAVVGSASPGSGEAGCQNLACSLSVVPDGPFANASPTQVTGTHFTPGAQGGVAECNMDPSAPTISVPGDRDNVGSFSVGCSSYRRAAAKVTRKGTFFAGFGVTTGVVGPPAVGTDSSGGSAADDAYNYPCPPTQAQVSAGISCTLVFQDEKNTTHEMAFSDISFTTPYTTTTTTGTTTTVTTTTTTTDPGCPQLPASVTLGAANLTVTPASCLVAGTPVSVTGTGLTHSDLGFFMECNTAAPRPTAWNSVADQSLPVGCTDPTRNLLATTASGAIYPPVSLNGGAATGTVGPPFTPADEGTPPAGTPPSDLPTDSATQAMADAPEYPCPPTPAQLSAGVTCALVFVDLAPNGSGTADRLTVPISFDSRGEGGTSGD